MRLVALCVAFLVGCPPTISAPRGAAHLADFAEATRAYHSGQYAHAAEVYGRAADAAERRVDRDEALYMQARAYHRAGREREALDIYDRIAQSEPVSRRTVRALYDACRLRERLGEREAAGEGYAQIVRAHPNHGVASRALFHWFHLAGLPLIPPDRTLQRLRALYPQIRESELGDDVLWMEYETLLSAHRRAEAYSMLEQIVREHPYPQGHRWDNALWALADLDEQDGHFNEAIAWLEQMLLRHESTTMVGSYTLPTFPRALLRIARLYRDRLHDHEAAIHAYRRFGGEFPRSTLRDDARLELGELQWSDGLTEQACEEFRNIMEEFDVGHARRRAAARVQQSCGSDLVESR